jgi:hypothetical protein
MWVQIRKLWRPDDWNTIAGPYVQIMAVEPIIYFV